MILMSCTVAQPGHLRRVRHCATIGCYLKDIIGSLLLGICFSRMLWWRIFFIQDLIWKQRTCFVYQLACRVFPSYIIVPFITCMAVYKCTYSWASQNVIRKNEPERIFAFPRSRCVSLAWFILGRSVLWQQRVAPSSTAFLVVHASPDVCSTLTTIRSKPNIWKYGITNSRIE